MTANAPESPAQVPLCEVRKLFIEPQSGTLHVEWYRFDGLIGTTVAKLHVIDQTLEQTPRAT